MRLILFFIGLTLVTSFGQSISLNEIMKGNEFIGHQPSDFYWSPDSKEIYFQWNKENLNYESFYAYNTTTSSYRLLEESELKELPIHGFDRFKDQLGGLYKRGNNLWIWDKKNQRRIILSKSSDFSIYKAISPDEFILEENQNLIHYKLSPFTVTQLTNFQKGNASPLKGKSEDFLSKQQFELFVIIQQNEKRETDKTTYRDSLTPDFISPIYLEGKSLGIMEVSPNLKHIVYGLDEYAESEYTELIEYVTADGKTRKINARPKVGSEDPKHELFLFNSDKDSSIKIKTDHLTGMYNAPEFLSEYPDAITKLKNPKNTICHFQGINETSTSALIEVKSYDNKDRWICLLNLESGELTEIDHQHETTWIGGPGITGWNMVPGNCGWIDKDVFYFQSEKTGFSHLYTYSLSTKKTTQITSGKFEIHETHFNKESKQLWLTTNKTHAGNRDLYAVNFESKKMTLISSKDGNHESLFSPDFTKIAFKYSYKNRPWELFYSSSNKTLDYHQITQSLSPEFASLKWINPEVITFKASDNIDVNARIYEPTAEKKNGAAIMFVHGAGYLQNAHNWWSGYYREYMFHNLLVEMGYTVMDIDYRASKGYGRDFRVGIYRHMGGKDLSDYVDGKKWLVENKEIDPERVGIYGGSYGGFLTLMALLTEPGEFKCGAAIRSVADWAHYNHPYTSNILNTPEEDPIAYKQSSPIYFADNLKDRLLMLHGMMDDNVQYQDVVRLSQRFIELGKKDWDLVGYPIEPHGFVETSSWVDEYGRILKMFEEELR